MRRGTLVLVSSLAAATVAGALVYGLGSQPPSSPAAAGQSPTETAQPQPPSPADVKQDVSVGAPKDATATPDERSPNNPVDERSARRRTPLDEAEHRERERRSALDEVRIAYTLLFDDLDLPEQDEKDLIALLVDMQIEQAWTEHQRGRTISEQERSDRISAVIGPEKLEQLIALEENRQAYWETYQIALLMQRRGVPTTPAQRDAVFDMLVDVREQYPFTPPPGELDRNSDEWIAYMLRQTDDFDRHVIELAPSVLSPTQVVYLFQAYDRMAHERIDLVEWQKKRRADNPAQNVGWMTPGRWSWSSVQP